jgi:N-methylhydantoinase A
MSYVRPLMSRYLNRLERDLPTGCSLRVMKSDGGVIGARTASQQAIQTALSGPAAGVIGAFHLASLAGYDHIITLDIGGTSTDVSLCPGGPIRHPEREIDGLPLRIRLLDIETIGAGGGSIARLDAGGALRVGPQSAGADPGPIIYGRGGQQITVSDANAILGRLDSGHFLGGQMVLDIGAARTAVESLAEGMNTTVESAALGIVQVANVNIDRAIQRVSVARGYDPRDFTLVAFGGAGPLHACEIAERLSIPRVLVPRYPGVLCAFGLLVADIVLDYSRSVLGLVTAETPLRLRNLLESMMAQARVDLAREGVPGESLIFEPTVDLRYQGQAYELPVPFTDDLIAAFHDAHARRYGHAMPERTVEAVNVRLRATSVVEKPAIAREVVHANDACEALIGEKPAVPGSEPMRLYEREQLRPGAHFAGPALVFQLDSTTFVAPGWSASVDEYRNLVLERTA